VHRPTSHRNQQRTGRRRVWTGRHHWAVRTWTEVGWTQDDSALVSPTSITQLQYVSISRRLLCSAEY